MNTNKKILWVSSYPKSGNTWVRHIISSLVDSTPKDIQSIVPSMHTKEITNDSFSMNVNATDSIMVKTHYNPNDSRISSFNTSGVIYIERNPMDVLLSSLNFLYLEKKTQAFKDGKLKHPDAIKNDNEFDHYVNSFISSDGISFFEGMCGKYSQHLVDWKKKHKNTLLLRYEELIESPKENIKLIADFLNINADNNKINSVIQEVEKRTKKNNGFYWKKISKNYVNYLNSKQIKKVGEWYKHTIKEKTHHICIEER